MTGIGGKTQMCLLFSTHTSMDSSGAVYIFKKFRSAFHIILTCFQSVQKKTVNQ